MDLAARDQHGTISDALEERLAGLAAALDDCPEPVVVIDRSGCLRYANPACESLFAAPPAALQGRPVADFATRHEATRGGAQPAVRCVLRGFFELRRADGGTRWVSYAASPLRRGGRTGVGAVVFLRDETERRHDEQRRSRSHDELEQALRAVAHDLRSPLVAVLGFSRLLRDDFGAALGDRGLHFLDRIGEAGRTMETLIRELLDFARIGNAGERRTLVDPREVLQQLRGELKPRLDAQGVELVLPEEPPLVRCDRTRLYQVFSNLIGNALDHMGPCATPRVEVTIDEQDGWHVAVCDNGRGVAPEERDRIFQMFHTVAYEGGHKGTGIGLAIVQKIAELHGGRAWVEGRPGAGAIFHVSLPPS